MLTVTQTRDVAYMKSFLMRPGIWSKAAGAAYQIQDPDVLFNDPKNLFFAVRDGEEGRGWIGFVFILPTVYSIHTALITLGSRTLRAVGISIDCMRRAGARQLIAYYPQSNKAVTRAAEKLGFKDDLIFPQLYTIQASEPYCFQSLNLI